MSRADLVQSAKRVIRMVDMVLPARSPKKQRPAYQILKDYIALAEGSAAERDLASTARPEGTHQSPPGAE